MPRLAACLLLLAILPNGLAASIDVHVRDESGKPVAESAVYATPGAGPVEARRGRTVAVEQRDREFVPYISVVQTGTSVTFPNLDPIMHHVYSFSATKPFEIKLYSGDPPTGILFDKPGVATLGCNIHDWMIGYILVVSTPYFAKTDAAGNARLRDLPAGAYEVRAWHPQQRAAAEPKSVSLEAGAATTVSFAIDPAPRKAKYKPPLDRLRY